MKNQKKTLKPFFNAATNGKTLEMMLYDVIGETYDGSGVTAKDVKAQLDSASSYDSILMRINSPGGDAFEGVAIHNLLRATNKPVHTIVDGLAASAASIVTMAGDQITMASNAVLMIHNAWAMCIGNSGELRKQADVLDTVDKAIAQTFVDRTSQSMDKVTKMMADETWMNASDAKEMGFCTDIANSDDSDAMNLAKSFQAVLKNMKNVPAALKNEDNPATDCDCDCKNCADEDCSNCVAKNCNDANCSDCPMQECACDCQNCKADDCQNCSALDCDDQNCSDCPMQNDDGTKNSNLSLYQARLQLLKLNSENSRSV
jgi:ATP-dependent protease ClpP protease subunit